MQDMKSSGDRSIRNVPVSAGNHRRSTSSEAPHGTVHVPHRRKRSRSYLWWGLGIIAVCIVAGLLLATLFEGATVTITPKTQEITPPSNITALPNAQNGSLGYQTISLSQSATTTATASGTSHISKQATGLITISNSFSTAPQALVVNTRFQAPDGKIYKIHAPITVPGAKKKTDGTLTPGTVTATIYADVPGAEYNRTAPTTFTIPGFKGDPKYTKFSGQSQGAISGGFVGDQPAISTADMQAAQLALQKQLDGALRGAIGTQVPNDFLPVQGSLQVTYSDIISTPGVGTAVSLSQTANATMAMVNSNALAAILAKLLVQGYTGEPVAFKTPNPLILQLASSTVQKTGPLTMMLQGAPTLVWQFDQGALKDGLLGKGKSSFQGIIDAFSPAIDKAQASIRPFWKATFPTDPSKLDLQLTY